MEICCECGLSVALGAGKWVDRIPELNSVEERRAMARPFPKGDFLCAACDADCPLETARFYALLGG